MFILLRRFSPIHDNSPILVPLQRNLSSILLFVESSSRFQVWFSCRRAGSRSCRTAQWKQLDMVGDEVTMRTKAQCGRTIGTGTIGTSSRKQAGLLCYIADIWMPSDIAVCSWSHWSDTHRLCGASQCVNYFLHMFDRLLRPGCLASIASLGENNAKDFLSAKAPARKSSWVVPPQCREPLAPRAHGTGLGLFQNFLAVWNVECSRFVTGFVCLKAMLVQQKASLHQEQSSDTLDTLAFAC